MLRIRTDTHTHTQEYLGWSNLVIPPILYAGYRWYNNRPFYANCEIVDKHVWSILLIFIYEENSDLTKNHIYTNQTCTSRQNIGLLIYNTL